MAWVEKTRNGRFRVGWVELGEQHYKGGFANKTEANRFRRNIEDTLDLNGRTGRATTLGAYAARLLDTSWDLRGSTLYNYQHTWTKHLARPLGQRAMAEISTDDLRAFFAALDAKPAAKAIVYRLLSKIFNAAENEGLIIRSPLRPISKPKVERREVKPLSMEEIEFWANVVDPEFRLAILLAGYAGLRAGEIGGLRISDVDFADSSLCITQATRREGGKRVLGPTKTAGSSARINIPRFLLSEISQHAQQIGTQPDGRLFASTNGLLAVNQTFENALHKAAKAAGRDAPRFHDFRHSAASLLFAAGVHPKLAQSYLRHSSSQVTQDIYSHMLPSMTRSIADILDTARENKAL